MGTQHGSTLRPLTRGLRSQNDFAPVQYCFLMNHQFLKNLTSRISWVLRANNFAILRQRFVYTWYLFCVKLNFTRDDNQSFLKQKSYNDLRRRAKRNPIGFNEKVLHRMAFDRNPLFRILSDKIEVRRYVEKRVGEKLLIPVFAICDSSEKLNWQEFPQEFVCKVSHGAGGLIGLYKDVEIDSKLPVEIDSLGWQQYWVNPESFNPSSAEAMLKKWLSLSYEWAPGKTPEWGYAGFKPRVIVEELLLLPDSKIATQIQFYVFNGKVKLIRKGVKSTDGTKDMQFYSKDWDRLPIDFLDGQKYTRLEDPQPKPDKFSSMISIAECLGDGLDFARVDLYDLGSDIRFGEMTMYPSAGNVSFGPKDFNTELGNCWKLDTRFFKSRLKR